MSTKGRGTTPGTQPAGGNVARPEAAPPSEKEPEAESGIGATALDVIERKRPMPLGRPSIDRSTEGAGSRQSRRPGGY
jgi:hypothetical protein